MEKKKLKIGLFSPYWENYGGGERYLLTMAQLLSADHKVYLLTKPSVIKKSQSIFGLDLSKIEKEESLFQLTNPFTKLLFLNKFDVFFYTTDGSFFLSPCKKNYLIIQSPIHLPKNTVINRLKMWNWQIICYSAYVKNIIEKKLAKKTMILPPCLDTKVYKSNYQVKENSILTVGRFFKHLHNKRQDVLIDAFTSFYNKHFTGWKLVVAGGVEGESGREIIENLRRKSKHFPVEIHINLSFKELVGLYKKAKIYWHAAGFGSDLEKYPEKAEHFGITTLEAMAAGAVPVVFSGGGQKEIVTEGFNGFLWDSIDELLQKTSQLINSSSLSQNMSTKAQERASDFSKSIFYEKITSLITS